MGVVFLGVVRPIPAGGFAGVAGRLDDEIARVERLIKLGLTFDKSPVVLRFGVPDEAGLFRVELRAKGLEPV